VRNRGGIYRVHVAAVIAAAVFVAVVVGIITAIQIKGILGESCEGNDAAAHQWDARKKKK